MSVDPALVLVYLPTTSSSSDFFGGGRVGDNRYTSSLVALRGKTGEVVWNFQFVHHNVFDYDTPSEPLLVDRSEEHTSELQSLMRISYAVFCLKKKNHNNIQPPPTSNP